MGIIIIQTKKERITFFFMNTETQNLIIYILGTYALTSLIGLFTLVAFTTYDTNIVLALVTTTNTPISILGGFIAGKTLTEKQSEIYLEQNTTQLEPETITQEENSTETEDETQNNGEDENIENSA